MKQYKAVLLKGLCSIIIIGVLIVLTMNSSCLKYEETSGTGINMEYDGEYKFTPMFENAEDVLVQKFSPVKEGLQAIQIRMANEHPDEIDSKIDFVILDMNRNELYKETVYSDEIENWRYYTINVGEVFEKDQEYILKIKCTNYKEDIGYRVFICNEELEENINLTFNAQGIEGGLDLIYSYAVFPVEYFTFLVCLCVAAFFILWIFPHVNIRVNPIIVLTIIGVIYFYIIEHLADNDIQNISNAAIVVNIVLMIGILFLAMFISNSTLIAGFSVGLVVVILGIINHYTLLFRQTVILPSDVYSIGTAAEVVKNYVLNIDSSILEVLVIFTVVISILSRVSMGYKKIGRIIMFVLSCFCLGGIAYISLNQELQSELEISVRQDDHTTRSKEIGFLLNLCENIEYLYISKPEDYSEAKIKEIYESYLNMEATADINGEEILPNIIVVMSESFSDLGLLGELETDQEYMSNFIEASRDVGSKTGECVVSVFGGGTSCTEFEFLTGCSMYFLGAGIAPYQQYIHSETDALPTFFNDMGYESYAVHAANPKSWNRNVAYPLLGFDEFISTDMPQFDDATYCRYWIDDQSMVNELENIYEENNEDKLFEFSITIQGHGGYDYEDYPTTVRVKNMQNEYPEVEQYLTLMQASDTAFGNLISYLEDIDDPTIVLMFGDHLPALEEEFYEELLGIKKKDYTAKEKILTYTTPYIMWSNYGVDISDVPDRLSANFLAAHLMKAAGLQLDEYWNYLYSLSKEYPVISRNGIIDSQGEFVNYSEDDACYEAIHNYEIIQYSRLN